MNMFSKLNFKSTVSSFLVLSAFLGSCDLAAGKRKREEEEKGTPLSTPLKKGCVGPENQAAPEDDTPINLLPQEVLLLIFSYLDLKDLPHVMGTCGYWNDLAQDNLLFKHLAVRMDPASKGAPLPEGQTYKEILRSSAPPILRSSHVMGGGKEILLFSPTQMLSPDAENVLPVMYELPVMHDLTPQLCTLLKKRDKVFYSFSVPQVILSDKIFQYKLDPRRSLSLKLSPQDKGKSIFAALTKKLHQSLKLQGTPSDLQKRICNDTCRADHSKLDLILIIHGLSYEGDLIYGSLRLDNPLRVLFTYTTKGGELYVEKKDYLENFPESCVISRDGLTLAGQTPDILFRWKLEKDDQGQITNSQLTKKPRRLITTPDNTETIAAISSDGNVIGINSQRSYPHGGNDASIWTENSLSTYSLKTLILQGMNDIKAKERAQAYYFAYIKAIQNKGNRLTLKGRGSIQKTTRSYLGDPKSFDTMDWELNCGRSYLDRMARELDNPQPQIQEPENTNMLEDKTLSDFDWDKLLDLPADLNWAGF